MDVHKRHRLLTVGKHDVQAIGKLKDFSRVVNGLENQDDRVVVSIGDGLLEEWY